MIGAGYVGLLAGGVLCMCIVSATALRSQRRRKDAGWKELSLEQELSVLAELGEARGSYTGHAAGDEPAPVHTAPGDDAGKMWNGDIAN